MSWLFWAFFLVVGVWLLVKRVKSLGRLPDPPVPGPKGYPVLGSMKGLTETTSKGMTKGLLELAKEYPSLCKVQNIFLTSYFVNDAALVKDIMVDRAQEFINHPMILSVSEKVLTNRGLIGIRDDTWRKRRKQLSPHFIATKISPMVEEIFVEHASTLVDRLDESSSGETVNLHAFFTNLTMDIIGDAGFGTDFDSQKNPDNVTSNSIKLWLDAGAKLGVIGLLPFWDKFPVKAVRDFFTGQTLLSNICEKVLNERRETGKSRVDLLQSLVDLKDTPKEDLLGEALLFLIAGHETTSSTLTWATYMISQNPEVEAKIVKELDEVLGGAIPDHNNVHDLKYLECVINETLRMHPPALITTRDNTNTVTLGGYTFPPRTNFFISIWALHHNDKYWPDPEKFDPERWTPENKAKHVPGSYLPFGLGPRMCIGYKFSLMETRVVLAMLYQKYTFKYTQTTEPFVKKGTLWRPDSLPMEVHRRD